MGLAGHGKSGLDRKTWSVEAFGDDVMAVVEGLDLDQVTLIGYLMGGDVVAWAEQRMPERVVGLIGIDTFDNVEQEYTQDVKGVDKLYQEGEAKWVLPLRFLREYLGFLLDSRF